MATRTKPRSTLTRATKAVKNAAKKVMRPVERALTGKGQRKTSPSSSRRRTTSKAGRK